MSCGIADQADIVIVDGGSTDGSLETTMLDANRVRTLLEKTAPGRLSAQLRCAYAYCLKEGYRSIVTIDGNDKDDPEAISRFIAALDDGYDFVQASRFVRGGQEENTPLSRSLAIRLIHAPCYHSHRVFTGPIRLRGSAVTAPVCCWTRRSTSSARTSPTTNCWPIFPIARRNWATAVWNSRHDAPTRVMVRCQPRSVACGETGSSCARWLQRALGNTTPNNAAMSSRFLRWVFIVT
ncbi:glycosyltransferase [Ralstonia insidiosa]|nr:glycosyltransferase [Ralstonia insidiosa]